MNNMIDGRRVTPTTVENMTNCRLRQTRTTLQWLLSIVEEEIEARMGKGGGGLQ